VAELAVDQRVAIALYRMVQEALTNVARHARARSVEVELRIEGDRLVLTVSDDGTGLAPDAMERSGSFGLMGLRERAHMLGGEFRIVARRGGGTRLVATLPLSPPASGEVRS
jgi:two-component system sensor histidine kinase UhpB